MPSRASAQGTGVITGRILDAATSLAVGAAEVAVSGTQLVALTGADGSYNLPNVPVGDVVVAVTRLGYLQENRSLLVQAGETLVADFALTVSAVALDGIVATAVGLQRRREIGNATSIILAARELETSTPTTFTDLVQGRAPGVQVLQSSGTLGSSATIKIRGNSSISLDNTPLIYIDGARASNEIRSGPPVGGQNTSRLNDLNPYDIESIEIVKGPSAATLYGTEAAAGVVRITTRRGRVGASEWTYRTSVGAAWDPTQWPDNAVNLRSPFLLGPSARDTVYTTNLLEGIGTDQDPWRTGLERAVGVSLRGGVDRVTYFIAGDWADREGSLPTNEGQQRSFRANLNLAPSDNVDVAVSTGFASTALELPNNDNTALGYIGVALNGFPWQVPLVRADPVTGEQDVTTCPIDYEGSLAFGVPLGTVGCPGDAFFAGRTFDDVSTISNRQEIERFTGSVAATYRPYGWLTTQGTVGYDIFSQQTGTFIPPAESLVFEDLSLGFRGSDNAVGKNLTAEGSAIGVFDVTDMVRSTTTVGVQFFGEKTEATRSVGRGLPVGTGTVSNAVRTEGSEEVQETRTLGLFIEEQLSFDDRFFLTPAVRFDENSAFGENLGREAYPRVMASYVISESPWFNVDWIETLRLRGAWGESGKQPSSFAAFELLEAQRVTFRGQDVAGVAVMQPGNPDLKPERGTEVELGFEADIFGGNVAVDFTWYDKVTKDAIVTSRVAPSTGFPGVRFQNIGEITNSGVELGVTAIALSSPDLFWTWQLVGATASGEITRLDDPIVFGLNGNSQRHIEGSPFGAYFSTDYTIGEDGEVLSTGEEVFLGHPTPEWEGSVSTTVRLYNRLTLYANLGFAGGHQQFNSTEEFRCGFLGGGEFGGICPAIHERGPDGQPTDAARVKAAAAREIQYGPWIEDADFARLRTVGARVDLPASWAAWLGASRADLTVTGENLGLWTGYSGLDPELNTAGADPAARAEFLTLPPARRMTGRISITF